MEGGEGDAGPGGTEGLAGGAWAEAGGAIARTNASAAARHTAPPDMGGAPPERPAGLPGPHPLPRAAPLGCRPDLANRRSELTLGRLSRESRIVGRLLALILGKVAHDAIRTAARPSATFSPQLDWREPVS